MGADNWAICPKCKLEPNPYYEDHKRTFREDFEIGMCPNGEFHVDYSGRCEKCGFAKKFRHDE